MKSSKLTLIVLIVLCAIVFFGSYKLFNSAKVTIYTFKQDYSAGTVIKMDMLEPIKSDREIVASQVMNPKSKLIHQNNVQEYVGKRLKMDVSGGVPFMTGYLSEEGGGIAEMRLSPDMTCMTIPVDVISAGAKDISPYSMVNIMASYGESNKITEILYQNVKVIDVITTSEGTIAGVTIEVTPEQSLQIGWACDYGKVRLTVNKNGQYKPIENELKKVGIQMNPTQVTEAPKK